MGPGEGVSAGASAYRRPPTAEELRDAFRRKRHEPKAKRTKRSAFAEQFPTESLFVGPDEPWTGDGALGPEAEGAPVEANFYEPHDPWAVLGVRLDATWEEVRAAHRRLALVHHPDRLGDRSPAARAASEAEMREINIAYTVLRRRLHH